MAHAQSNCKTNVLFNGGGGGDGEETASPSTFHDFLGNKNQPVAPPPEVSASATSDLGSEFQPRSSTHLEGVALYGIRANAAAAAAMAASSSHFAGPKRSSSNSDSFTVSVAHQIDPQDRDSPLLTKLLRYSSGHEVVNHGSLFHNHPQRGAAPFGYQPPPPSSRLKDTSHVSLLSQMAADEGSRTGIKRQRLVASVNPLRQPTGKQIAAVCNSEAETATNLSHQMTVFYGGQAHVFDNVPPNKADVIMALAGSSGGSWSTSYKRNALERRSQEKEGGSGKMRDLHSSEKGDV